MTLLSQGLAYAGSTLISGGIVQPTPSMLPVTVTATTGGSAHTAGTAVEVSSSLAEACQWLFVGLATTNAGNGVETSTLLEVRTGASLDVVALTVACGYRISTGSNAVAVFSAPMPIAAGTRVGIATRSTRTSRALTFVVGTFTTSAPVATPIAYGVDTATSRSSIVLPDPASTGTPGAWVEIAASTASALQGVHLGPQGNSLPVGFSSGQTVDVEIGYGAASSEVVCGALRLSYNLNEHISPLGPTYVPFPGVLPAGSRLVARMTKTTENAPCDLLVHGIPLGG